MKNVLVSRYSLLLIGCTAQKADIPKEIRSLDNLTVYPRPENPDTLLLHREQTFSDSSRH
ncbi:MAG: hypothetical protein U5J63_04485 [Fodinibius sp.]|nr:hypothetical protein [Fodinibius sp.]